MRLSDGRADFVNLNFAISGALRFKFPFSGSHPQYRLAGIGLLPQKSCNSDALALA